VAPAESAEAAVELQTGDHPLQVAEALVTLVVAVEDLALQTVSLMLKAVTVEQTPVVVEAVVPTQSVTAEMVDLAS
jgi:hypothetical protein